jgi:hypothetical protein
MSLVFNISVVRCAAQDAAAGGIQPQRDLLSLSHGIASELTPAERAFFLVELTDIAASTKHPDALAWVEEGLAVVQDIPRDWNRDAIQKNLLVALSVTKPSSALELLAVMGPPISAKDQLPAEDVRADAARTIFPRVWSTLRFGGLDPLRNAARRIGETGQYPYAAMSPIIGDVAKQDSSQAIQMFLEAVAYFSEGKRVKSEMREYAGFLAALNGVVSPAILKEPVTRCLEYLAGATVQEKNESFVALAVTDKSTTRFNSQQELLFAQLLPVLQTIDPSTAKRFTERQQERAGSSTAVPSDATIETATVRGSSDPLRIAAAQNLALQSSRVHTIQGLGPESSQKALELRDTLSDAGLRAKASAIIASKLAVDDPKRAEKIATDNVAGLDKIKEDGARLTALAALISMYCAMHSEARARKFFDQAFDLGEALFERDEDRHPQKPAYEMEGFDTLNEVVSTMMPCNSNLVIDRVLGSQQNVLKAYLLIAAVRAKAHH